MAKLNHIQAGLNTLSRTVVPTISVYLLLYYVKERALDVLDSACFWFFYTKRRYRNEYTMKPRKREMPVNIFAERVCSLTDLLSPALADFLAASA